MATEKRLIDANKIKYRTVGAGGWGQPENVVSDYEIEKMPTVDATEVVHGRWVKKWHDNNLIGHEYEECSVCGSCVISDTEKFWDCNYCPNCGAKMDRERKENG